MSLFTEHNLDGEELDLTSTTLPGFILSEELLDSRDRCVILVYSVKLCPAGPKIQDCTQKCPLILSGPTLCKLSILETTP